MLKIGLFPNFKGADTVLIDGAPSDIVALSTLLAQVVVDKPLAVHEIAAVAPRYPVTLFAATTSPGTRGYWWKCSSEEIETIQGKLEPLTEGGKGHQYFDLEGTNTQLMISVGEYGSKWWQEHG